MVSRKKATKVSPNLTVAHKKYAQNSVSSPLAIIVPILLGSISTTNLAACVCVCAKFDQFLPARFYFVSKRPENCVRIAKFPYAAFGPLFAFHCPLFVTKNNNLGWNRHPSPHTGTDATRSRADGIVCARTIDASNDVPNEWPGRVGSLWPSFEARLQAASGHLTYSIYTAKL